MELSRRTTLKLLASALPAVYAAPSFGADAPAAAPAPPADIAPGPFKPDWDSLKQYKAPEWFRDAKFGIWAHWTAQCVPEQGDWYARNMYIQGHPQNKYHVATYGHPTKFGFMQIDNLWKADKWNPEALMDLYVNAGAKYFVSLANHHDNFDTYDSSHHAWNATRIGPMKDIVGTWAKLARARGLRFGVTNHSSHAWHWFQTAYGYDAEGPLAGARYDAYTLKKEDGQGKWWQGYDPQGLYVGRSIVIPDGITTMAAAAAWHRRHDGHWYETAPPDHPEFVTSWFLRTKELIDKYSPDLLYFDDTELPFGDVGLAIAAHLYNTNIKAHGRLEAVLNSKGLRPDHVGTMVLDIERGLADRILPDAWQTDTCIGDWHYKRSLFEQHKYKSAATVINMLIDIISKNGNLLLNIPLRGNGEIDADEHKVLTDLASWVPAHGEAIYGTRPFTVFGEGPTDVKGSSNFNEKQKRPYGAQDIRFTAKGNTVFAFGLGWPENGKMVIKSLSRGNAAYPGEVGRVDLVGGDRLDFTRDANGLNVTLPEKRPGTYPFAVKITPA